MQGADGPLLEAECDEHQFRAVAQHGGNITDLTCRLVGELYVMTVEVDLADPTGLAEELVAEGLAARVALVDEDVL